MGIHVTKGKHLAQTMRKRGGAVKVKSREALRETMRDMKHAAEGLSNARAYRMPDARQRRFRPYSKRRPRPPLPAFEVNKQTGELHRSWRTVVNMKGRTVSGTLYNTAPHSIYFTGNPTRNMISRPILQKVKEVHGPKYRARVRRAVQQAMSKR